MTMSMTNGSATANYQYDGKKERVSKTVNGTSTLYLRGTNDYPLVQKTGSASGSTTRFYVYGPTGLVAVMDGGTPYFIVSEWIPSGKDHLGSVRAVLNSGNTAISWYSGTPTSSM